MNDIKPYIIASVAIMAAILATIFFLSNQTEQPPEDFGLAQQQQEQPQEQPQKNEARPSEKYVKIRKFLANEGHHHVFKIQ